MKREAVLTMVLAAALAGCAAPRTAAIPDVSDVADRAPSVERVRVELSTAFAPASAQLTVSAAQRLESFLDQSDVRPNDTAYVAVPPDDPLAAARVHRLEILLAERGVGLKQVAPPPSGVAANHVLIMVDRYIAMAPACPDWSQSPATQHVNTPRSNFGCATATDFALMIDNPRDLVMGRTPGPAGAEPAIDAVERYRTDRVKPLVGGSTSGAAPAPAAGSSMPASGGSQ